MTQLASAPTVAPSTTYPTNRPLTNEQVNRYKRHLILPRGGHRGAAETAGGQGALHRRRGARLPDRAVLGCRRRWHDRLADVDVVSPSNLQRQILFGTATVGQPKVKAAADRLRDLNPDVKLVEHKTIVDSTNVLDLVSQYDVIIDGTDNFPTRYCVNDACVNAEQAERVRFSIFRFEGMITGLRSASGKPAPDTGEKGPCYRCLVSGAARAGLRAELCRRRCASACCRASSARCRRTR